MAEKTLEEFKKTLDVLIDANPHARNKGDEFKEWIKEHFDCDARISYIKEQRQITNRVSEQFRYFAPIVVFVCVPEVKRDTLIRYILGQHRRTRKRKGPAGRFHPAGHIYAIPSALQPH